MNIIPKWYIEKLKDSIDMVELASQYTELKKFGKVYIGRCPHKNHTDKTPSFRVWPKDNSWACMTCHYGKKNNSTIKTVGKIYGSDCIAFIQWVEDTDWNNAIQILSKKYNIPIPSDKYAHMYKKNLELADEYHENLDQRTIDYLKNRGLEEQDAVYYKIGRDNFGKITFPLLDRFHNVLGFTRRWLNMPKDRNDKYVNSENSPIFTKGTYFYGMQNFDNSFDEIRITEGTMDVILSHKFGAKNIVCTLGTALTEHHIQIIKELKKVPVLCLDGDEAGIKSAIKNINELYNHGIYAKILILPNNKDLADISLEERENIEKYIVDNSMTYGYMQVKDAIDNYNKKLYELQNNMVKDFSAALNGAPEDELLSLKTFINSQLNIKI